MKEVITEAADVLFDSFSNKTFIKTAIANLSRNTVTRRVKCLSRNTKKQLAMVIDNCEWFSSQLDESTYVMDIAQVFVFIRMTFSDFSVKEELLTLLQLKGTTKGEDIFNAFTEFAASTKFPLCNVAAIPSDGAESMTGSYVGLIAQCKRHIVFPSFMHYHSIINHEIVCSQAIGLQHVMDNNVILLININLINLINLIN